MVDAKLEAKLAVLKKNFAGKLAERIDEIAYAHAAIERTKTPDEKREAVAALRNLAHKMKGSAPTFGFKDVGETAWRLEDVCNKARDADEVPSPVVVEALLVEMRDQAAAAGAPAEDEKDENASESEAPLVVLLDAVGDDAEFLAQELGHFGYRTLAVSSMDELRAAMADRAPAAVVMEIHDGEAVPIDDVSRTLSVKGRKALPLLFLSERGDMETRLAAVRTGADAFLSMPVNPTELVDALDALVAPEGGEPFRVLVIDDDISMAKFAEAVLQGAGAIAESTTDPMAVLDKLGTFAPELILLDLYMPGCEGWELAAVIRQQEAFAGVPIVFLSGEEDMDKQQGAMSRGGDDFLTKPIKPDHLIAAVRSRARRFRMLRALMVRDGLTGLYNHTTTVQLLQKEMDHARRDGKPLALAMLDIDHFKSVNDTHGHGVGDVVIKSLARLLKQRMRSADIVGRMGGEEFAVVLPDATVDQARDVMEGVRESFARVRQPGSDGPFAATLSCGVAEAAQDSAADALEAADKALYAAKNGGRNRVVAS